MTMTDEKGQGKEKIQWVSVIFVFFFFLLLLFFFVYSSKIILEPLLP